MTKESKNSLFIFIFVFVFSFTFNIINIETGYNSSNFTELKFGYTIPSPDDKFYLPQIANYVNGYGFTSDPTDLLQSVRRTPGYPIFFGVHYLIFGEENAHYVIRIVQCLIFALSAIALGSIARTFVNNQFFGNIVACLYGTSLFVSSFLFLTITESISPALVIFSFYFFYKGIEKKNDLTISKYMLLAVFIAALATLVRPTNGILLLSYMIYILYVSIIRDKLINGIIICTILSAVFSILFIPWTIRNYSVMKMFIPLETFTIHQPFDGQGFKEVGLKQWQRAWGPPQDILKIHTDMLVDLSENAGYKSIENFIEKEVPNRAYAGYSKLDLRNVLMEYQNCLDVDIKRNGGVRLRWGEIPDACEYEVGNKLSIFADKIREQEPFLFYIEAPLLHRALKYVLHSGMHTLKSFQGESIGPMRKIIKSYAYLINILLWILSLAFIFSTVILERKILLATFMVCSFSFLVAMYHVEGRYMISSYPFLYLMASVYVYNCHQKGVFKWIFRFSVAVWQRLRLNR